MRLPALTFASKHPSADCGYNRSMLVTRTRSPQLSPRARTLEACTWLAFELQLGPRHRSH
eukprot:4601073-Amphidinium_carterae.1